MILTGALLTAFGLAHAADVRAQEVRGSIAESTGQPIGGAFVSLLDQHGAAMASTLSGLDGAYVLRTAIPGRYVLRVERIGYETWNSAPFSLRRGEAITRPLQIPIEAVRLDDLVVSVESHCRPRPGGGAEMARLWEEARKALELNRWTEEQSRIRFVLRRYERDVHAETGRVLREETRSVERRSWRTFVSAPPEELQAEGWVRRLDAGGWRYFAPDAETLLSDAFADGHCFSVVRGRGDEEGLVGLSFEPIEFRRPDVAGVLWLDPATAEIRHLDYRYTELDLGIPRHEAGGRLEFGRLPTGHWFVRSWVIRMPMPAERTGVAMRSGPGGLPFEPRRELVLSQYRHAGGDAVRAQLPDGESVALAEWTEVTGMVRDETGSARPGIEIELVGTPYRARTDGEGRFRIVSVPPGEYTVVARDPDTVAFGVPGVESEITVDAGPVDVQLLLESSGAFMADVCAHSLPFPAGGDAAIYGVVRDRATGEPAPGTTVWVARQDWALQSDAAGVAVDETWTGLRVQTDMAGRYTACGLPEGDEIIVQAGTESSASELGRGRTDPGDPLRLDLELAPGQRLLSRFAAGTEDVDLDAVVDEILAAIPDEEGTGLATLVGTVRSADTGEPVSGVRVRLIGRDEERVTGAQGTFVITDLPRDRYRVVTERLGLASDTAEVDLRRGAGAMASLMLETRPVQLPTLEVEIERTFRTQRLAGYYDRRQRGLGDFITREDLEIRDVISNFRRIPSVRIQQCITPGASGIRMANCWDLKVARGYSGELTRPCPPLVYVDGHLLSAQLQGVLEAPGGNPFTVLQSLPRHRLEGIEIYRNAASAPAQYRMLGDACGIVLVWTRGR